jgi:hypothetical protein
MVFVLVGDLGANRLPAARPKMESRKSGQRFWLLIHDGSDFSQTKMPHGFRLAAT